MARTKKSEEPKQAVLLPIWCDHCRLRIAPYERSVMLSKKNYHPQCQEKLRNDRPTN